MQSLCKRRMRVFAVAGFGQRGSQPFVVGGQGGAKCVAKPRIDVGRRRLGSGLNGAQLHGGFVIVRNPQPSELADKLFFFVGMNLVIEALENGDDAVWIPAAYEEPTLYVRTRNGMTTMTRLSRGKVPQ